ncbi:hypothetical protein C6X95_06595 [Bacillus pumilus]|nr:hypothetical protein C6X95_06595 [Bacillus pumilus]
MNALKQPKNNFQTYKYPGKGAVEFAKELVDGMGREDAASIIKKVNEGSYLDESDKRVKRCAYCGYFYRDKTKPNNSRTCCKECKIDLDTFNRKKKKADKELLNPKKKTELRYVWWLEYPYWLSEEEMIKWSWKYEAPYPTDKIATIAAKKQEKENLGGRQKKSTDNYYY